MNFSEIMAAREPVLKQRLTQIFHSEADWREVAIISSELSRRRGGCACPGDWITAEKPLDW